MTIFKTLDIKIRSIPEKFSTIIDTEQMKEDKVYDKYKTKERKSITFHILKIDNKDIKKRGTK